MIKERTVKIMFSGEAGRDCDSGEYVTHLQVVGNIHDGGEDNEMVTK